MLKMIGMRNLYSFLLVILFFSFCSRQKTAIKSSKASSLDDLLKETIITNISINVNANKKEVRLSKKSKIGYTNSSSGPVLSEPRGLIGLNDSIYIADREQHGILVMDLKGEIQRKIGRMGKGPGEYVALKDIFQNDNYVFTADPKKGEIQIFDKQFDYLKALPVVLMAVHHHVTDATKQFLFTPATYSNKKYLIDTYKATSSFKKRGSFFPKLIPNGYQPMAYNRYLISADAHSGNVIIAYTGLPYLFLFDENLTHQRTINIQSEYYKKLNNPPVRPVQNKPMGIKWFFQNIYLAEDGSIFFTVRRTLYRLSSSNDKFRLSGKYQFLTDDGDTLNIRNMLIYHSNLYLSSAYDGFIYSIPAKRIYKN